jgi:hypothetical protein
MDADIVKGVFAPVAIYCTKLIPDFGTHLNGTLHCLKDLSVGTQSIQSSSLFLLSEGLVVHELIRLFSFENVRIVLVQNLAELKVLLHL